MYRMLIDMKCMTDGRLRKLDEYIQKYYKTSTVCFPLEVPSRELMSFLS